MCAMPTAVVRLKRILDGARRGGRSRSRAKVAAARKSVVKAQRARVEAARRRRVVAGTCVI